MNRKRLRRGLVDRGRKRGRKRGCGRFDGFRLRGGGHWHRGWGNLDALHGGSYTGGGRATSTEASGP